MCPKCFKLKSEFLTRSLQTSNCVLRRLTGEEYPSIVGFVAGLSMAFYRSKTISYYVMWKTIEVNYAKASHRLEVASKAPWDLNWSFLVLYDPGQ